MKHYSHSKTSTLLFEIMINIFFFALLIAFCLQLFVKSYSISHSTAALNHAVSCTTGIAECFRGENGNKDSMQNFFPDATLTGAGMDIYYDKNFTCCEKEQALYVAKVSYTTTDTFSTADINYTDIENDRVIYQTTVTVHLPLTGGTANET